MFVRAFNALILLIFLLLPTGVYALDISASNQGESDRIIFTLPRDIGHRVSTLGNRYTIIFQESVGNVSVPSSAGLSRVKNLALVSDRAFEVVVNEGSSAQVSKDGTKIIVTVSGGSAVAAAPPAEKPVEAPPVAQQPEPPKEVLNPPLEPLPPTAVPAPQVVSEPLKADVSPHTITLSSSNVFALAAFRRGDRLWLVTNQPDMAVFPQVEGKQAEAFPPFDKLAINRGTAYRVQLPGNLQDAKITVEGAELVWRLHIAAPDKKPPVTIWPTRSMGATETENKLSWRLPSAQDGLLVDDPLFKDQITVVPVKTSGEVAVPQEFLQFELLESFAGLALLPETDMLNVSRSGDDIVVTTPEGLAFSAASDVSGYIAEIKKLQAQQEAAPTQTAAPAGAAAQTTPAQDDSAALIRFEDWRQASLEELEKQEIAVMAGLAAKTKAGQAQDLIALAKSNLAHGQGAEAKGLVDYAIEVMPDLAETPEIRALRGIAFLFLRQPDLAYRELSSKALDTVPEAAYWRSVALAMLEDWQQAGALLPQETLIPEKWPDEIKRRLMPLLAEAALRKGDVALGTKYLNILERDAALPSYVKLEVEYLKGESARQRGDMQLAEDLWQELSASPDDLFRARGGLALATLQYSQKKIDTAQAIDKLERLRYAWRGDALEMAVNFRLGQVYMEAKEYLKAFSVLRNGASLAPDTELSHNMTSYMVESFKKIFTPDVLKEIDPLLALTIYEEFGELLPLGDEGKAVVQSLANRMSEAGMLEKSAQLLGKQMRSSSGVEAVTAATQLAAVRLIDKNPEAALKSLEGLESLLEKAPAAEADAKRQEIVMLRARAYSQQGKMDEAFKVLNTIPQEGDALRLRADIAWQAGRWPEAAESLERLVQAEKISATRPMSDAQADLVLNWAIALNLADNRYVLANVRERYGLSMQSTKNAKLFDVVSRARQNAGLADRETIRSFTSEVDMFKGFLESYRN